MIHLGRHCTHNGHLPQVTTYSEVDALAVQLQHIRHAGHSIPSVERGHLHTWMPIDTTD